MRLFLILAGVFFLSQTLMSSSAVADEVIVQYSGKREVANGQLWLGACLVNRADAKVQAFFQFGYNPKEEKWRKMTLPDGGSILIGQTFLEELGAPKMWVKYVGTDGAAWTESMDGTTSKFRPKQCSEVQRAAFVEETDGHVTLKLIP